MPRIFFSYAREDRPKVSAIASALQARGLEVLIDYEQIGLGASIPATIDEMIRGADGAVMFFSSAYARKAWTKEEQFALQYRLVERPDFQVAVVKLEPVELPPLLAHRVWLTEAGVDTLAKKFGGAALAQPAGAARREIDDWLQVFSDAELERMGHAIQAQMLKDPRTESTLLMTKTRGAIAVHLAQPSVARLRDNLAFLLRSLEDLDFIRSRLRERIAQGGLSIFEPAFMLEERRRMAQLAEFRQELRETLDAMVERIVAG